MKKPEDRSRKPEASPDTSRGADQNRLRQEVHPEGFWGKPLHVRGSLVTLRSSLSPPLSQNRGIALVLTLGILAIVTLMVIAFATSMRVENMASKNFNDLIKARELANAAVDHAVATIREATPIRTQSGSGPVVFKNYVTFPGAIWNFDNNGTVTAHALYSWNAFDTLAGPFDLNDTANNVSWLITGKNGEFQVAANSQINVGWVYVAEDGSMSPPNSLPLVKPIIGRFAFWVDDEASKININTAGRGLLSPGWPSADPYGASDPLAVDLSVALLNQAPFPAAIVSGRTPPYLYATIEEVKRAPSTPIIGDNYFTANRFSMTAYSDDAGDLDVFDRPRRPINALNDPADFNTVVGSLSAYDRLADTALARICSPPAGPAVGTFAGKYPVVGGVNGLQQIIANIIAYQFDPQVTGTGPPDGGGGPPPLYLGLARTPYVNEVQISYKDNNTDPPTITRTVSVELFYPYSADATYTPSAAGDTIVLNNLPAVGIAGTFIAPFTTGPVTITVPAVATFNPTTPYRVFAYSDTETLASSYYTANPTPPPTYLIPSIAISLGTITVDYYRGSSAAVGYRLDCAQVPVQTITYSVVGPPSGALPVWHGAEVNDPCVNENTASWTLSYVNPAPGTLGAQNSVYVDPGTFASKMHIRGAAMNSIGELGYIHTPNSWQYLKLQPGGGAAAGQIPDWAMLDIFTVGATVPNVTRGRNNINSSINPVGVAALPSPSPGTPRQVPLLALLNSLGLPASIALDVYKDDNTATARAGNDPYGMSYIFDTIGEICEIRSLATGANEAAREAAIRRIANLLTVRSNTFTIWVIAQSIKEPNLPSGQTFGTFQPGVDLITGEVRAQAVVERYEMPALPAPPTAVNFRTRYFRYIYQ